MNPDGSLLSRLRGLHLPPEPSLWPPAPGWWVLAMLALVLTVWGWNPARRAVTRWRRRREALRVVAGIRARAGTEPDAVLCAELSMLLRRVALERFPGEEVAALTGQPWLGFLERSAGGEAAFAKSAQALLVAPYRRGARADVDALAGLVERWLRRARC